MVTCLYIVSLEERKFFITRCRTASDCDLQKRIYERQFNLELTNVLSLTCVSTDFALKTSKDYAVYLCSGQPCQFVFGRLAE